MSKIEEKNGKKTLVIVVSVLLALSGVVSQILGNIQWMEQMGSSYENGYYLSPELIAYIIVGIATICYVLFGYKKPHGNLLKYTFLLLAVGCVNGIIDTAMEISSVKDFCVNVQLVIIGLYGVSVLLIAYIAGRLDKIKKNYVWLGIITAAQIVIAVLFISIYDSWDNFVFIMWDFSFCLLWIDLLIAYIIRFREHKEAGLTDKK